VSAFPQDMLLYPDGQPRVLNSENRLKGEINGVSYVVDLKGDFAICQLVNTKTGESRQMWQPRFSVLGLIVACTQLAGAKVITDTEYIGLRSIPGGGRLSGY
jgi:hypothetical protein